MSSPTHPMFSLQICFIFYYNYCYINISSFNVALMYVCMFSAVNLELDNLRGGPLMEKTDSPYTTIGYL